MPIGRKGGRNSIFPRGKRNIVTIWLYEDDYKALREEAAGELTPMGTIARKAVVDYVRQRQAERKQKLARQQKLVNE